MPYQYFNVSILALLLASGGSNALRAQTASPQAAPQSIVTTNAESSDVSFSRMELEKILTPIALYPDVLLAQLLPASAYPLEIVQAARWLDRNRAAVQKNDYAAADAQNWDPSVKSLLRFPDLVKRMNDDLDWTSDLGDAFVHQPQDVAEVIQSLRAAAEKTGALKTTKEQTVSRRTDNGKQAITIEPTDPQVVYVPTYQQTVYDPGVSAAGAGLIGFGTGVIVGSLVNNAAWNWGAGVVYPPVWAGYPGWRPPAVPPGARPGVRPPRPDQGLPGGPGSGLRPGGGNINIGNDINIGGGNLTGNAKPWRPDPDRYRPGQGSKPGLSRPAAPGGSGRPGEGVAGGARPSQLPAGGERPGGGIGAAAGGALAGAAAGGIAGAATRPRADTRPAERPGQGAQRPGQSKPGAAQRPTQKPGNAQKPGAKPKPGAKAPASRTSRSPPRAPSAFGGMDMGRGATAFGARGAVSRGQAGFGGGEFRGGGAGPRGGFSGGGMRGGGGSRGGGFRGGGGGGRRR